MAEPQGEPTADRSEFQNPQIRLIFTGLILAILLASLDQTIVATALPTIAGDLHGLRDLSWVVTSYLLTSTVVMPAYGKVGDLFGRKNVFLFAIVVFLLGSVLAGLSQSMLELIVFRGLQGAGAGGLFIGAQAIIGEVISPRNRGRYLAVMMPLVGVASVVGPLIGGFLTESASWRWIFYINLPVGGFALAITASALKLPRVARVVVVDYWGIATLAGAASCVVLLASWAGTTFPWVSAPIIALAAGAVLLVATWLVVERRTAEPVMAPRLFGDPVFSVAIGLSFAVGFVMIGVISFLPAFFQLVRGASPSDSGLELIPQVAGMMVASVVTGQLIVRTGRYKVFPVIGTGAVGIGLVLLSQMGVHTPYWFSSIAMATIGLGLGLSFPVLTLAVQNSTPYRDLGAATSGSSFFRQIGGAMGVALGGTLFSANLDRQLRGVLPPALARKAVASADTLTPELLAKMPARLFHGFVEAFARSLPPIFLDFAPLLLVAFVLSWFLPEKPLGTRSAMGKAHEQEVAVETAVPLGAPGLGLEGTVAPEVAAVPTTDGGLVAGPVPEPG